jgi:replication factor A1
MKIAELRSGMNHVDLKAKIVKLSETKEILTKFGTVTTLTEAKIEDDTGSMKLVLWGKQSEGIEEGNEIEIKNGFVKVFRDELQLSIGRNGSIKVV